jgi:hypothetical protein
VTKPKKPRADVEALDAALAGLQQPAQMTQEREGEPEATAPAEPATAPAQEEPAAPAESLQVAPMPAADLRELELNWHRLQDQLTAAEDALGTLENERTNVALGGGDIAAHSRSLIEARETVRTLEGAVVKAKAAYDAGVKAQDRDRLKAHVAQARETNAAAVTDAWRDVHSLLTGLKAAFRKISDNTAAIEVVNFQAEHNGLPELQINTRALRAAVAEEIHGGPLYQRPESGKAFRTRKGTGLPNSGRDPMDEFNLHEANKESQAIDEALRKEPFTVLANEMLTEIQAVILEVPEFRQRRGPDRFRKQPVLRPSAA